MAENIDVNVNVNTNVAQRNLNNLNKQVQGVQKSFGALKSAVAGIAIGAFATNILKSANAVFELSQATGIAVSTIQGLSQAFVTNGSDAESAQKAIVKFNKSIDEARQGSGKTQNELSQLGITLDDLRNLSETDLLRKTIQGLDKLPAGAQRTALAMSILGKGVNTVDFKGLNSDLDNFIATAKESEPTIASVGKLFNNLQNIGKQFGDELLKSGGSIVQILEKLTANTEQIAKSLAELVRIATILGVSFLIFSKVLPAIKSLGDAFFLASGAGKFFSKQIGLIFKNLVSLPKNIAAFVLSLVGLKNILVATAGRAGGIKSLAAAFLNLLRIGLRFAGLIGIIYGVAQAFNFLAKTIFGFDVFKWLSDKLTPVIEKFKQFLKLIGFKFDTKPLEEVATVTEEVTNSVTEVVEANLQLKNSVKEVTQSYKDFNQELVRNIGLELQYLKLSEDNVEIAKVQQQIFDKAMDSISDLQKKKANLKDEEKSVIPIIDEQIRKIEQSITADQIRAENAIKNLQAYRLEQERLNNTLELTKQQLNQELNLSGLQQQLELVGQYGEELENNLLILDVERELQSKLLELQFKQLELEKDRGRLGEARFQQEMAHLNTLRQAAQNYANSRIDAEKKILEAQRATQENARLGAEQAIYDISKQFKPYTMAQEAVKKGWDNISSAIDDFAKTGKFKFSDFARSVIADFAKIIAKALIFKAIQSAFGGFGIPLPGLAKGGPAKQGQPYIVGEKGPELFVPKQSGTVVPNNKLGNGQGVATGAVNAPITNNYITNNISAVDAKSVAQLFAENRKSLLGAVATAQREMPYMA
jgi:lambda family phage tail tape measure protein